MTHFVTTLFSRVRRAISLWSPRVFFLLSTVFLFIGGILWNTVIVIRSVILFIGPRKVLRGFGVGILWCAVLVSIGIFSYVIYLQRTLPDPDSIATRRISESTKIYDYTGTTVLYDIHGEEKRTVIPWEDIPDTVKKATLASEDSDFYQHKGLDITGIIRAFIRNLQSLEIEEGGSTITQQLIKQALIGTERTATRKIKEAILSIEVERRFTKDEIFWMYLNQIPYGSNAYGIESAAKTFFGIPAKDLSINQAATLAALTKSTTRYSPYGSHVDQLIAAKNNVLRRMFDLQYISQEQLDQASSEELVFQRASERIVAPHFVIMIREYLVSQYGEEAIQNGGFKIISTLDADLQKIAEETVSKYGAINDQKYRARNAALVSIDPLSGKVRALVGSRDYFNPDIDGNYNIATARRQPGSSFKPFAYALLFKKGYPDDTILFDVQTEFNPNCPAHALGVKDSFGLDCYNPQNYDGKFRGPVSLRQALSQSLNIPAVKALYLAGVQETADLATAMGITTLQDRERFGLSLVLGGAEVRLVDMASAYGVFATEGIRYPWYTIERIELPDGSILEEHNPTPQRVLDTQAARLTTDVLSDNNARAPVFGFSNTLYIPGVDVAAKTGTTQDNKDAWVVGYTSALSTGVWTGNNDNKPMSAAGAGISAAGPLWNEFMRRASELYPSREFIQPDPVMSQKPMLNGQYNDPVFGIHSILYYVDRNQPLGSLPFDPSRDSQFLNWETSVRALYGGAPSTP